LASRTLLVTASASSGVGLAPYGGVYTTAIESRASVDSGPNGHDELLRAWCREQAAGEAVDPRRADRQRRCERIVRDGAEWPAIKTLSTSGP
jgi:hypothetical protein